MTGSNWLTGLMIVLAACPIVICVWWATSSRHRDARRARIAERMDEVYQTGAAFVPQRAPEQWDSLEDRDDRDNYEDHDESAEAVHVCAVDDVWDDPEAWDDPEVWQCPEKTVIIPLRANVSPRGYRSQPPPAYRQVPEEPVGKHRLREEWAG